VHVFYIDFSSARPKVFKDLADIVNDQQQEIDAVDSMIEISQRHAKNGLQQVEKVPKNNLVLIGLNKHVYVLDICGVSMCFTCRQVRTQAAR